MHKLTKFRHKGFLYTFMISRHDPNEKYLDYRGVTGGDYYRLVSAQKIVMIPNGIGQQIIDNHWKNLTSEVKRKIIAKVRTYMKT